MASVNEFVEDEVTLVVIVSKDGRKKCTVQYRPSEITQESNAVMARREESGDRQAFLRMFADVVSDWDVEGELYGDVPELDEKGEIVTNEDGIEVTHRKLIVSDGVKVPLMPDTLRYMPFSILMRIWRAINEDLFSPNQPTASGSKRRS